VLKDCEILLSPAQVIIPPTCSRGWALCTNTFINNHTRGMLSETRSIVQDDRVGVGRDTAVYECFQLLVGG
jgi:hypothetical protein